MLELRDLIIDRIRQIQSLQQSTIPPSLRDSSLEAQTQFNVMTLKQFSRAKKQEKQRIKKEQQLLQEIKPLRFYHSSVIENFYNASLSIFSNYDPGFLSLLASGQTTDQRLQQLYSSFIAVLPPDNKSKQLSIAAKVQILELNPFILMSWVCEWSRRCLADKLKEAMESQLNKDEPRMASLTRSNIPISYKQKSPANHLTMSSHASKLEQNYPAKVAFTNKESVYSYFLQNLSLYYKSLPLEVDYNFLKSIRKAHGKSNEFEREQNLERATQILIECKNKNAKEQLELYRKEYYAKYPKKLKAAEQNCEISPLRPPKKTQIQQNARFFQRIKSQTKQKEEAKKSNNNRNSYLLCPKANQISFDSSKETIRKLRMERQEHRIELPEIMPHRMAQIHSKSTANRTKPVGNCIDFSRNSVVGLKGSKIGPRFMEFKQPLTTQKITRKNNKSCTGDEQPQSLQNPQKSKRGEGDEFKRNRKLMLQLLRERNRYAFLDK